MSVAFWVTTIVIVATPGTGALYAVRTQVISRPRVMTWMRRVSPARTSCWPAGWPSRSVRRSADARRGPSATPFAS